MKHPKSKQKPPNPGSEEARNLGCTCPVLDNCHGKGVMMRGDTFWMAEDCPLHGINAK